jgi:type I restriction enzyme S subunit
LTKGQILGFDIPIPPAAEQARIVAKVAALLAHVNAARQRLAKVPAILKRFRQSVVAAACSGRLTADLREQKVDLRPLAQFDQQTTLIDENGPPEIPGEWRWETLCSVAEYQGGYAFKSPRFIEVGKNQVLRIGNVRPGFIDPNVAPVFITEQDANQVHRFELQENDILISMTGTRYKRDYGFVGLVPQAPQRFFLNQRVSRLRCNPICLSRLLFLWLQTETFRNCFFKDETGNVNQGNVGATPLKAGPVALPPIPEQHEIVRRVEVLFRLADAIEKRVATATARAEKLTQAILAKAFRGELVPTEAELARREGRDYEPASALLERIRAERNGKVVEPKPRRRAKRYQ